MSLCTQWTLVKDASEIRHARPLYCRSWNCEICAPRRRAQLMAKAAAGEPQRFITLTVNPAFETSPERRLRALARAWRVIMQRLRRLHPGESIQYLAIVEETALGEPHLHILFHGPYIPQAQLSEWMGELIDAPIVDIRLIRNRRETIRYVAKYVTKAPARLGTCKRYWTSQSWEPPASTPEDAQNVFFEHWRIDQRPLYEIVAAWIYEGYACRQERGDQLIGIYVGFDAHHARPPL